MIDDKMRMAHKDHVIAYQANQIAQLITLVLSLADGVKGNDLETSLREALNLIAPLETAAIEKAGFLYANPASIN